MTKPASFELGVRFPALPIYVVPGGQHGGSKDAGFVKQVGSLPEVDENLFAFAQHHFFGTRPMVAPPKVTTHATMARSRVGTVYNHNITVIFPDNTEPQKNEIWWSLNRHPDYTFAMEYDEWKSAPMVRTGPATFETQITTLVKSGTLDFVTVHQHTAGASTLTLSSPLLQSKRE